MSSAAKTKKVGMDLTTGPILKSLIIFASPMVLANLIQQLYSVVDLIVIGKFVGSTGTVGVSLGGEVSDMVTPIATSLCAAGQIYIAQLFGGKEIERMRSAAGTLLTFMAIISAAFMAIALVFHVQILHLLNCPESAFSQATSYMIITVIGIPFIFGYNAVCSILRGLGESKAPMTFIIIAAVINIVLDLIFVIVFHMEAAGTAIATMLSQAGSFIASVVYMWRHREALGIQFSRSFFRMNKGDVKVICRIGIPQAIRSTLVRFSMFWVNSNINSFGIVAASTNSIGNKIQKFLDIFTSSLSQASAAMVGQNLGARKNDRAGRTVLTTFLSSIAVVSVIIVVILIFPDSLYRIFTNDEEVIKMGVIFLHIFIAHFIWSAVTSSFQSMVIGSGFASMNFVIGILDGIVCKIGLSLFFTYVIGMGVTGFFWGTAWSRAIPGIICVLYFASGKWKSRKLLTEK